MTAQPGDDKAQGFTEAIFELLKKDDQSGTHSKGYCIGRCIKPSVAALTAAAQAGKENDDAARQSRPSVEDGAGTSVSGLGPFQRTAPHGDGTSDLAPTPLSRADDEWPTHCIHGLPVNGPWCAKCRGVGLGVMDDEVVDVAWAILSSLHENVQADKRPMSWSDVDGDQEQRIRSAAVSAIEIIRTRDRRAPSHPPREQHDGAHIRDVASPPAQSGEGESYAYIFDAWRGQSEVELKESCRRLNRANGELTDRIATLTQAIAEADKVIEPFAENLAAVGGLRRAILAAREWHDRNKGAGK